MSNTLRILRITPHLFRSGVWSAAFDPVGGMQTQVWKLTEEMDRIGISQTVLTSWIPGSTRRIQPFNSTLVECLGVSLPQFAARRLMNFTWALAVMWRLFTGSMRYDLIHIHYNHSIWCRALTVIAHHMNVPVVITLNTELWVENGYRLRLGRFDVARWIEQRAIKSSDRVIVLTDSNAARWARELPQVGGKIVVIPDAVAIKDFAAPIDKMELDSFCRQHSIPKDSLVVGYVGRIRSEKGWEELPEITKELFKVGAFLLICGDGPDRRRLEMAMRNTGCPNSWRITGFLDPAEIKIALHLFDVLILPSRREAFGSVLLEAMASGVPAVAYGVGGILEVAGVPNAIFLVPPNDRLAFKQAILDLLRDRGQRELLIERGRQRVADFELSSAARRMTNVYQNLSGHTRSACPGALT
ncbi:MAG: glycosyl transferase group 1 [Acidobacteria bacterium]|jgi:glycosyltransferase involved in cell wall biosynthesis|nr:glycosyl transferase group 1 [Acidobacteriota bacterium]